jgi:hypothetical protein
MSSDTSCVACYVDAFDEDVVAAFVDDVVVIRNANLLLQPVVLKFLFIMIFPVQICAHVADLWPGCKMVTGSARHSPSNGGIERFNRTIQSKVRL